MGFQCQTTLYCDSCGTYLITCGTRMPDCSIREDMRYYLRQKMEQAMQGVADAEPPVDAEPAV